MFGAMTQMNLDNNTTESERNNISKLAENISTIIADECQALGKSKNLVNGSKPSDLFALINNDRLILLFKKNYSGNTIFTVKKLMGPDLSPDDFASWVKQEHGTEEASSLTTHISILDNLDAQINHLEQNIRSFAREATEMASRAAPPLGFNHLENSLKHFYRMHPNYEYNVFIAMRFDQSKQHEIIRDSIKASLSQFGYYSHFADDKTFSEDGDLWNNVCTYMIGCKYGICVFEEINERNFNPNVQIEFGFMRALNKKVLLLKDQRQPKMPTDIVGKIYREFDSYDIEESIRKRIEEWVQKDIT
jgi:hypothetical protein